MSALTAEPCSGFLALVIMLLVQYVCYWVLTFANNVPIFHITYNEAITMTKQQELWEIIRNLDKVSNDDAHRAALTTMVKLSRSSIPEEVR